MNTAELDRERAELLPDRQALGWWNLGWHGSTTSINVNVLNHVNILNVSSGYGL